MVLVIDNVVITSVKRESSGSGELDLTSRAEVEGNVEMRFCEMSDEKRSFCVVAGAVTPETHPLC